MSTIQVAICFIVLLWTVTTGLAVRFQAYAKLQEARARDWGKIAADCLAETDRWAELHRLEVIHHREELKATKKQFYEIETKLREQVQHMAERLSTLRVEHNARPEMDRFVEDPKPREPYSQQLTEFINGIQYEDARQLVEEEIETLRFQDATDEQIYDIISKGSD